MNYVRVTKRILKLLMCSGLLIVTVLVATTYSKSEQTPEFFSVDPVSPIVTVHGKSPADIFDPALFHASGPPPEGLCRSAADLGLDVGDNVDAISVPEKFYLEAVETHQHWKMWKGQWYNYWTGNFYFWSVDRDSVGRTGGDFLIACTGGVPSTMSPVLDETTTNGNSACGDVFVQIFDQQGPPLQTRLNMLWYQETDLEETGGAFGAAGLDELDALERNCDEDDRYFFSVDAPTATKLGVSPASVLRVTPGGGDWAEVLTPADLGLEANDDIDALQIWGSKWVERDMDNLWIVFSLAPGSPSLTEAGTGFTWSPADLFLINTNSILYPGWNSGGDVAGADNRCWIHAEYLSLEPEDNIDSLFIALYDPGASDPNPPDLTISMDFNIKLSWTPGYYADSHDVYLGTDFNDVNDANNSLPVGASVYKGNFSINSYDPCSLEQCMDYYWRVDEVNEDGPDPCFWPGYVWSFRTRGQLIGDFDCNNIVNFADLSFITYNWLASHNGIPDECEQILPDIAPEGGDGIVNFLDYALWSLHWLEVAEDECPLDCDINDDGKADLADLIRLKLCIGTPPEGGCAAADLNCDGVIDDQDENKFMEECWIL